MNTFVGFFALLAVASASPLLLPQSAFIIPAVSNQYHSQDGIGQYSYGYNDHLSSKTETKSPNGVTQGAYSYIDANNVIQTVSYIADAGGFRVTATNLPKSVQAPVAPVQNLPQQVEDTQEVAAAKSAHFAAIEEAKKQSGYQASELSIPYPILELPRPVEDTPEVAQAKAEHLAAIEQAKLRNSSSQKVDSQISLTQSAPLPVIASPIPLTAYSSLPFPGGFSYSSSVVNSPVPVVQYVRYL